MLVPLALHSCHTERNPICLPCKPPILTLYQVGPLPWAHSTAILSLTEHSCWQWLCVSLGWSSHRQLTSPMSQLLLQYMLLPPSGWGRNKEPECVIHTSSMPLLPYGEEDILSSPCSPFPLPPFPSPGGASQFGPDMQKLHHRLIILIGNGSPFLWGGARKDK